MNITNTDVKNKMVAVDRFSGAMSKQVTIMGNRMGMKDSLKSVI
jgi:hypothetical protein